jgi:hypothetical protein
MDRKELITMWEKENPETPAESEVAPKPTYEELEKLYATAVLDKEQHDRTMSYYRTRMVDFEYKIEKADEWITEQVENSNLTESQTEELCEILGLNNEVTKTITLEVSVEVEVSAKRGYDFDDISEYDFDIEVTSSSSDFEVESVSTDINSVDAN